MATVRVASAPRRSPCLAANRNANSNFRFGSRLCENSTRLSDHSARARTAVTLAVITSIFRRETS